MVKLIVIISALLLALSLTSCSVVSLADEQEEVVTVKADVKILEEIEQVEENLNITENTTANKIYEEFRDKASETLLKYEGNEVTVSGYVTDVWAAHLQFAFVKDSIGGMDGGVEVRDMFITPKGSSDVRWNDWIKIGDFVTVTGNFTGYDNGIIRIQGSHLKVVVRE